jgi:PAS domain S-box-containing protein
MSVSRETANMTEIGQGADSDPRELLDTLSEVVFRTDAQGRWTYLNRAWTTLMGFEVDASLGARFLDYVHPDELEHTVALFMGVVAGGADHCHHETRYRTHDGSYRWVRIRANVLRNTDGEVTGNSGTIVDITDSRLGAEALGEHAMLLELVSAGARPDDLPVGVIVYGPDGRVRRRSGVVDRLVGTAHQVGDALDRMVEVLGPAKARGRSLGGEWGLAAVALRTDRAQLADLRVTGKRGSGRWLRASVIPFAQGDEKLLALILSDISDLHRAERRQAGLAQLGQRALSGLDVPALQVEAVELVASTLDVERADLLDTDGAGLDGAGWGGAGWGGELVARACVGRPGGPRSIGHIRAGAGSLVAAVWAGDGPLIVNDLAARPDLGTEDWLHGCGVAATVAAPVGRAGRVFGVLAAHSVTPGRFAADEGHFVQSVANVLAAAVERDRAERELRRLYERARRGRAWLAATAEVTAAAVSADPRTAFELVASRARLVTSADVGAIVAPTETGELVIAAVDAAHPLSADPLAADPLAADPEHVRGLAVTLGAVDAMRTGRAVLLEEVDAGSAPLIADPKLALDTFMIIPLVAAGEPIAALILANGGNAVPFAPNDLALATAYASDAARAIELSRAQRDRARLAVFEDRDRIARDLHDLVIQRLFGIGLRLQILTRSVDGAATSRLTTAINELDQTIDEIRRTIFQLRPNPADRTAPDRTPADHPGR